MPLSISTEIGDIVTFANLMPDLVLLVDEQGEIHHASDACQALLGHLPSELIGESLFHFTPSEDLKALQQCLREIVATHKSNLLFRSRFLTKQDTLLQLQWSAKWLSDEHMLMCTARDTSQVSTLPLMERGLSYASTPLAHYEKRVLELLLTDASEKQIADRLGLTVSTTHSYVTGIFRKFKVRGRAGLMSLWIKASN